MIDLETIPQSIKLLHDWVQEKSYDKHFRHFTIAFVRDEWQVSVAELIKQSDDEDANAWLIETHKSGGHLLHVVNEALAGQRLKEAK